MECLKKKKTKQKKWNAYSICKALQLTPGLTSLNLGCHELVCFPTLLTPPTSRSILMSSLRGKDLPEKHW
jgi:hypothetical protein